MTQPILDVELRAKDEASVSIFERLASDPNVSVEKIERLMALWERGQARQAEMAFNAAMTDAQQAMGPIVARGWNPETRSHYRKYEDIDRVIRPIYTGHGFAMSFSTQDSEKPDEIRVTCRVSHREGHARDYAVTVPSDGKGIKGGLFMTRTHAMGSGLTYGKRYLADLVWNLAMTEDDDGNAASQKPTSPAPSGFEDWWADMQAVADEGLTQLEAVWRESKPDFRRHLTKTNMPGWEGLKRKAEKVQA